MTPFGLSILLWIAAFLATVGVAYGFTRVFRTSNPIILIFLIGMSLVTLVGTRMVLPMMFVTELPGVPGWLASLGVEWGTALMLGPVIGVFVTKVVLMATDEKTLSGAMGFSAIVVSVPVLALFVLSGMVV